MNIKKNKKSKKKLEKKSSILVPLKDKEDIIAKVSSLAEPLCQSEGMELVHIEYQQEPGGKILRVYIDKLEGIKIDDCANISRQLGNLIDVNIEYDFAYNLEISSPGFDRPLSKRKDFEKFKGSTVKIKTKILIEGQKNFKGDLMDFLEDNVIIISNDKKIIIPYNYIIKARLVTK